MSFTSSIFLVCLCLPLGALGFPEIDPAETFCCLPDQITGVVNPDGGILFYVDYEGQWAIYTYTEQGNKVAFDLDSRMAYNLQKDGSCTVSPLTRSLRIERARCIPATVNYQGVLFIRWGVKGEGDDFNVECNPLMTVTRERVCEVKTLTFYAPKQEDVLMTFHGPEASHISQDDNHRQYTQVLRDCNSGNW